MAEVGYFQGSEFSRQGQGRERKVRGLRMFGGMCWEWKEMKAGVCIGGKSLYN